MRWLIALFALLLVCSASADVRFIQIGDPQFGYDCAPNTTARAWLNYDEMTRGECLDRQKRQAIAVIEYGIEKDVDFFVWMGDHNHPISPMQDVGSDTRQILDDLLTLYPSLDFRWTMGNHDYEANCSMLRRWMLQPYEHDARRIKLWDIWQIENVHFISYPAGLFGNQGSNCATTGDTDLCTDINGTTAGACSSDADPTGRSTCAVDEFCEDLSGWQADANTAIVAALGSWATAFNADNSIRLITFSHFPPWFKDDILDAAQADSAFKSPWVSNIESAISAANTTSSLPVIQLFGHWHQQWEHGVGKPVTGETGITDQNSVHFSNFTVSGPVFAKRDQDEAPLSPGDTEANAGSRKASYYWRVDASGNVTKTRVLHSGQKGGYR